jgi:succinate dehydrogenase/fumarate reductase flavoprotein subunit
VAESTVYGARVGDAVANWVKKQRHGEVQTKQVAEATEAAEKLLNRQSPIADHRFESPWSLRDELGKIMWERAGIVRSGEKLKGALADIASLQKRAEQMSAPGGRQFNLTWQQALDMRNMLLGSELIARSALSREDSRGAHYREDFPNADNVNWLKNIYMARNGDGPEIWTEPVKLSKLKP